MHVERMAHEGEYWEDPEIQAAADVTHRVVSVYYTFVEDGMHYHCDAMHPQEFTPLFADENGDDSPPVRLMLYNKVHSGSHCEPLFFEPIGMAKISPTCGMGRSEEREEEE